MEVVKSLLRSIAGETTLRRLAGVIAICLLTSAGASASNVLWYGGDAGSGGFINNSKMVGGLGSNVLDNFVVSGPDWHVTGLFSNNWADYPFETSPFTQGSWSVRTGAAAGNFGRTLFSGVSPVAITPTGRLFGEGVEYTVAVSGLAFDLVPGIYFMEVSPLVWNSGIYYVGETNGTNSVGVAGPSGLLWEDHYILDGFPQDIIHSQSALHASMGVIGTGGLVVPEPGTAMLLNSALSGLFLLQCRRRRFRLPATMPISCSPVS